MVVGFKVRAGSEVHHPLTGGSRGRLTATLLDGGGVRRARLSLEDFGQVRLELPPGDNAIRPELARLVERLALDVRAEGDDRNPAGGRGGLEDLNPSLPGNAVRCQVDQDQRRRIPDDGSDERPISALERLGQRNRAIPQFAGDLLAVEALKGETEGGGGVFQARLEEQVVRQDEQARCVDGRHKRGSSIVCCFWYFPFLSA